MDQAKYFSIKNDTEFKITIVKENESTLLKPGHSASFIYDEKILNMRVSTEPRSSDSPSARQFFYPEIIDSFKITAPGKYKLAGQTASKIDIKEISSES